MTEENHVGERHQGRPLAARRHVAGAEVAHHPYPHALGNHRRVPQLQRRAARLVPDRLPVRRDEGQIARGDLRLGQELQHGPREALAQGNVQQGQIFRAAPRDGFDDLLALRHGIGVLSERDELRVERLLGEAHERRRDPVERRAGHHADGEGRGHAGDTGGGSPAA